MKNKTVSRFIQRTVLVLLIAPATLMAQSSVWINNAAGNWSDTTQWTNGVVADGAGNTADFSQLNLSAARIVTMDASHTLGSLLFSDTASTFFGWTIVPVDGTVVLTLNNGGNAPIIAVTNATSVITVPIAGTAGFNKVGPAQLTLSATNTLTGGITVSGGTLFINAVAVTPGGTNLTLVPQDLTLRGATVNLNDAANQGSTMQGFVNLNVNAGQSFLGQSRGSNAKGFYLIGGTIARTVGGTLDVPNNDASRTQTFATNSAVAAGNILANGVSFLTGNGFVDWYAKAAASPFNLQPVTYTASTATTLAGNANITTTNGTTLAANAAITSLRYALASNTVVNLGGFALTNGGTLLSAAVTAGNGLTITNGTLLPPPNQDVVLIQNGAGTLTVAATIADNGSAAALTKSAAGLVILATNNSYSGVTYLNAGTLQAGNGGTVGDLGGSTLVQGQAGGLIFNRSDAITFAGQITGPITLTKSGGNALTLTANSTFSGSTTISAGTLQLGNGGAAGSISNSASIANNGTLIYNLSGPVTLCRSHHR